MLSVYWKKAAWECHPTMPGGLVQDAIFASFSSESNGSVCLTITPTLYEKAAKYEKEDSETGERYTWSNKESLAELRQPERVEQIKAEHRLREQARPKHQANQPLTLVFREDNADDEGCLICHL